MPSTAPSITATPASPPGPTVASVLTLLGRAESPSIARALATQGITTLDDLRRAGGTARVSAVDSGDVARLLDAHADLARLSSDPQANAALIARGFNSTLAIAVATRATFLAQATPVLGPAVAARVHVAATALYQALDQVAAGARIDAANGVATGLPTTVEMDLNPQDAQRCQCCACQAATSPAAYLADLLAYVVHHLRDRHQVITLQTLVDAFHQPFGDLPTDCEAVDQIVRQVRICSEVLRSYLLAVPPTAAAATVLDAAVAAYVLDAYSALLAGAGTTYEELRLARHGDLATRLALAGRLGLTIDAYGGGSRPDVLDQLLLDPTVAPPAPQALGEASLERVFGLADTTRNPLSDGLTLNDTSGQITRWNLSGVVWGRNTDPDGGLYVVLAHDGATSFRVALYRDASLTALVASGEQTVTGGTIAGPIAVVAENDSGLSGRFAIASPTDTNGIVLAAVSLLTAWQLQTLRKEWAAEDHPADDYTDGTTSAALAVLPGGVVFPPPVASVIRYEAVAGALVFTGVISPDVLATLGTLSADPDYTAAIQQLYVASQRPPVIDADVLGPDDFRVPIPKAASGDPDQPYDLWLRRRSWVDTTLATIAAKTKLVGGVQVPDVDAMFATLYLPATYGSSTVTPWASTTPATTFETLWGNLAEGVDVPETQRRLGADLALAVEPFNRLMDIRHADAAAAADARNATVTEDAWREFRSILVQAMKSRLFAAWRAEEAALPLDFGADVFVVSLREPAVGDWPPLVSVGTPLIDPALVTLTDLPEPTAGARALTIWQTRTTETATITAALRTMREGSGLDATLRLALGNPNPGDALPVNLDTLALQLLDPNPAVVAAATARVQSALFMSVSDFNRVMAIRTMDADPNPLAKPAAADWIDLYTILTAAQVAKRAYPTWVSEEANPATGVTYWTARKAALPLWRSTSSARDSWHEALAVRSSAPIIDPDVIGPADLVDAVVGNAAFDLWQARTTWVQTFLGGPAPATLAAVDTALSDALGLDGSSLVALVTERDAGADITARLSQLAITDEAFTDLIGARALVAAGALVMPVEWDGFWSILVQARKARRFATWRREESAAAIILGPDLFQPPAPPPATPSSALVLPLWRATAETRQAWDDLLGARVEQQDAVGAAEESLVDGAEGTTLTELRDALVMATASPGADLADKADWFTTHLMIDALTGGCQKTTRIEQAVETLQTVMTGVRDGQIAAFDVGVTAAPAVLSFSGTNQIEVIVLGPDSALWHKSWDGAWGDWESLGGAFTSAPAVCVAGAIRYVFGRGTDNALWYATGDGSGWSSWNSLGGILASAPAGISTDGITVDVYALGTDGGLWHRTESAAVWQPWTPVARAAPLPTGGIPSAPAVATSSPGVIDLVVRAGDGAIWHAQASGGVWSGWTSLGGYLTSDPALTSANAGTLDVFARGTDWAVWHCSWIQASGWTGWTSIAGFAVQGPGASSWGAGRLDVFIGGSDGALWHSWYDGVWHPWEATDAFSIDAPNFDAEWTWMGSYATWRAAILVFMYPENLLQPSLRKYQTPAFQTLVAGLQSGPALTAATARDAACTYDQYFRDVCSITVECSCRVWSRLDTGAGCTAVATPRRGWLLDLFGRARQSNTAYWSSYDETDTSGYPQTFWDVVPGLGEQHLVSLFGSTPFWVAAGKRYVFLFFTAQDPDGLKLRFTRYDPEIRGQNGWEGVVRELAVPGWTTFTAQMSTQLGEGDPPRIAVTLSDGSMYERQLNRDGTDWSTVDWIRLNTWMPWTRSVDADVLAGLELTVVSRAPDQIDAFWIDWTDGSVHSSWANVNFNGGNLNPPFRIDNAFGGVTGRTVSAVARGSDHLDIFVVANGGTVYTNWWDANIDGGQWHTFQPISPPGFAINEGTVAAVARVPTHLDLFVVSPDGHVWSTWWDANPGDNYFHPWFAIGNPVYTTYQNSVVAVARGPGHLDVFMIDTYGNIRQNLWDASGTPWASTWQSIAQAGFRVDPSQSPLTAVVRTPTRVDVFVGGTDTSAGTEQTFWDWTDFNQDFGGWHSFIPVQAAAVESFQGFISALGRLPTHLDIFVSGMRPAGPGGAAAVFSTWQDDEIDGASWHPWYTISDDGGDIIDAQENAHIAAVSRIPNRIDLFVPIFGGSSTKPGGIYSTYWQGVDWAATAIQLPPFPPVPNVWAPLDIPDHLSSDALQTRRALIQAAFAANAGAPLSTLTYLEESYYFVPVYLAQALQGQAQFTAALDWYRTVYDYGMPVPLRNIYYGFELEKSLPAVGSRLPDWLLDPLDPHLIAATRRYAYARYTILSIVRCFLAYADARFTFDSAESDAEARTLYMTAIALLELPIFAQPTDPCEGILITFDPLQDAGVSSDSAWAGPLRRLRAQLLELGHRVLLSATVPLVQRALAGDGPLPQRIAAARTVVATAQRSVPAPPMVGDLVSGRDARASAAYESLLGVPTVDRVVTAAAVAVGATFDAAAQSASAATELPGPRNNDTSASTPPPAGHVPPPVAIDQRFIPPRYKIPLGPIYTGGPPVPPVITIPAVSFWFCTPPNPLLDTLRSHAELNLYKLRHCLNIAGIVRQVDPYSAPTDVASGLPTIGTGGQLLIPGAIVLQPTPYRYPTLIDRAKNLLQLATQLEAAMLSALEKRDAAAYDELQARQNLAVATATVQLQTLAVAQATDAVVLAQLQQQRAGVETDHWQSMLGSDIGDLEQSAIDAMTVEAGLQVASSVMSAAAGIQAAPSVNGILTFGATSSSDFASSLSSLGASFGTVASIFNARASAEAQQRDWQYQYALGVEDQRLATQQVVSAQDGVRIAAQQRAIARLQATQSADVVEFLTHKFTNAALYDWMSTVLQGVYSYFLRQATAVARLAENQMAFERQEVPPGFIKADYWQPPTAGSATTGGTTDTAGLTGAERLLQDVYQLDQYYQDTNTRKLQLTKTISLAQRYPIEFQRLRESGVMTFRTTLAQFDQDFPGTFLCLIQNVRTSVIALIPPAQGIKATLSTTAATRVVIGPQIFQKTIVRRDPESIGLTAPTNATGVFELDPQSDLLRPFEGLGVEAQWLFTLAKAANPFDFSTLADVVLAIDYTALQSSDYRAAVLRTLGGRLSAERPISFRNDLVDPWYDLHNPDQTATPMTVRFETARTDFPPNLDDLRIEGVLLYFARADGSTFEIPINSFRFTPGDGTASIGGAATTLDGVVSTRRGNAASWMPMLGLAPFGAWELALPTTAVARRWFMEETIEDILFVITYGAQTPSWPAG